MWLALLRSRADSRKSVVAKNIVENKYCTAISIVQKNISRLSAQPVGAAGSVGLD